MYKPNKKTLEKLGFKEDCIFNSNEDRIRYVDGIIYAESGSESYYVYTKFKPKNLAQMKALVEMFTNK